MAAKGGGDREEKRVGRGGWQKGAIKGDGHAEKWGGTPDAHENENGGDEGWESSAFWGTVWERREGGTTEAAVGRGV